MTTNQNGDMRGFSDDELADFGNAIESKSVNTGVDFAELLDGQEDKSVDVYYIELNNWFAGRDYPIDGKLKEFVESHKFNSDEWCKENKLCVVCGNLDMSLNWCITSPAEWVQENCPELLTDEEYSYEIHVFSRGEQTVQIHTKKYSDFLRHEDEYGGPYGREDCPFLEYREEN